MQKRFDTVTDPRGNVVEGATVEILTYPGGGIPTIYSDDGVALIAGAVLSTDEDGYFEYYAPNGHYTWRITTNAGVRTVNDILHDDSLTTNQQFVVATGAGDALVVAAFATGYTLANGDLVRVRAPGRNTITNPTIQLPGVGVLTIFRRGGQALQVGDIVGSGHELLIQYRATAPSRAELLNYDQTKEFFTPDAYGATGDGVADDTTPVQNALNAGDLYLPPGRIYKVTATVTHASKRRVWGPGKLRAGANAISVLRLSGAGSTVEGISLDNPGNFTQTGGVNHMIGIDIRGVGCKVIGCNVDNLPDSIYVFTGASDCTVVGNVVTNGLGVSLENMGDGISTFAARTTVVGNTVECKAGVEGRVGLCADLAAHYSVFSGNTVRGPWRRAVHIELSDYCVVQGNTCVGSLYWGIICAFADGVVVDGNTVDTPATATYPGASPNIGIYFITNVNPGRCTNNTVIGKGAQLGIEFLGNGTTNVGGLIAGNSVLGAAGKITLHGILVANLPDVTVADNYLQSGLCSSQGINMFQSSRSRVSGNSVTGCGSHGIIFSASHEAIVSGNTCRNNTGFGIDVVNSNKATVCFNRCYDDGTSTQTHALELSTSPNTLIYGNDFLGNATAPITTFGARDFLQVGDNMGMERESRNIELRDDFLGDVLADQWNGRVGSDGACVTPTILANQRGGVVRMVTGAGAGATMAVNGVQLDSQLNWRTSEGGLVLEARVTMSAITNVVVYIGFTDQVAALAMPFTLAAGDVLTSNSVDAVGVLFDTGADTDNWFLVGVANNVDAAKQNTALAPVAATFETWRIEVTAAGAATFYRNGTKIGATMAGAVTPAILLTPVVASFARAAASRNIDADYLVSRGVR